jgi:RimJ/RimL family protein N-acetyltransferase
VILSAALDYIREYRDEDAEKVARMWRESAMAWPGGGPGGGEHSTAARVREEQRDLNTLAVLVAYRPEPETGEERAVGYLTLYEYTSELDTAYVGILSAHPAWHGQGVGRDLLRLALERTVQLGYSRLDLNTWAGNLKAVPLYKKSGYFWVPDTTVKMENYLPLIFRLPAAQRFFEHADWYGDLKRDLSIRPDDERRGNAQVYTYRWERDGRALTIVIDRRAKGVAALEGEGYAVSLEMDDPRVPVGGQRTATWRIENRGDRPIAVSVLSEGEDAVRCTTQRSGVIEWADVWSAPVGAERPAGAFPTNRPANRIKSTVIVDGEAVPLVAGTVVSQPLTIDLGHQRFLLPGVPATQWITLENPFDEPSRGTVRLSPAPGLEIDRREVEYQLEPRSRMSAPLQLRIDAPGALALRAQATVQLSGRELATAITSRDVFCGEIGELFVEQTEEFVRPCTDRFAVYIGLKPAGSWTVGFSVWGRESGGSLLSHGASLGPPFVPSPLVNCTWTPRVERRGASVLVVLSADPPAYPGLTFERHLLISPSGIIRVTYRLTNAGSVPRTLQVNSGTSVQLSEARGGTSAAAHLTTGLVVEDSDRFPDWGESAYGRPDRYAESWMCEFGDGWVGATIWTKALEAQAGWMTPDLILDAGTIEPGQSAETDPIYVYAGQGDWKTARALWRQLVAPDGPRDVLDPRPAHRARLERFAFDSDRGTTSVVVESERARPFSGEVRLERGAHTLVRGVFEGVKVGAPAELAVEVELPERAEALETRLVVDHERTTETFDAPLLRVGIAAAPVCIEARREGDLERVRIENGRLRLTVIPSQLARVAELSLRAADQEWQNQLHAPPDGPDVFVWFNPWFGGLHPLLDVGGWHLGRNHKEHFAWAETERTGAHAVRWRGITCTAVVAGADVTEVRPANGLRLEISYLTTGESNLLAIPVRVVNGSAARVEGSLQIIAFLQPGGDRSKALLHYERDGQVWTQKRVHGGPLVFSEAWTAVSGPTGSPAIAVVPGAMTARVGGFRDMGHEGAHPNLAFALRLAPGETFESVGYLVVGDEVAETRRYKILRSAGALV